MAKTTKKLASMFKAHRFNVAVSHDQLTEAYNRCVDVGLIPKPVSFGAGDPSDIKIIFTVVVPCPPCTSFHEIWKDLEHILKDSCISVMNGGSVNLLCRPLVE